LHPARAEERMANDRSSNADKKEPIGRTTDENLTNEATDDFDEDDDLDSDDEESDEAE
jgi:hypothetical protein